MKIINRILTAFVLVAFAGLFVNAPVAEAGKKSHKKSEKHSSKHSSKSKKSDKKSDKKSNKKSDKKSHKNKKKHKNFCKVDNPNYSPHKERKKSKKLKRNGKSEKKKHRPYIYVPAGEFFLDLDGDGFGDSSMTNRCPIEGYVASGGDCAVNDPFSFPGAAEVCGDGVDNNCDGQVDEFCGTPQSFVDIVGDCDAFGSEQPYSTMPDYFALAIDEGTGQDGSPTTCSDTPNTWTHVLDELPSDAVVTGLTLQINSFGIDDATALADSDVKLFVDGVEVEGAFDLVSATNAISIDYIELPPTAAADGIVEITIDRSGGATTDCALFDYGELVVDYFAATGVDSEPAGFCQNGDQPAVPVTCPCGNAAEISGVFFSSPEVFGSTYSEVPEFNRVKFGVEGGNTFEIDNRIGPEGIGCRLTIDSNVIEVGPLNSAEVGVCTTEIRALSIFLPF